MIGCVLAATDGSEPSLAAVNTAIDLVRSLGPEARLHVASVVDYAGVPASLGKHPVGAPDLLSEQADEALARAAAAVSAAGVEAEMHRLSGAVVESILGCAAAVGADLLVVGFHGHSRLARLVIGSVTGQLVRSAALPVVVVTERRAPAGAQPV
ncbi:MAG TPA: universal stress protein [Candidatus Tumulicola sp.]